MTAFLGAISLTAPSAAAHEGERTRCAMNDLDPVAFGKSMPIGDCSLTANNPSPVYSPTFVYDIPIVVHVIQSSSGAGYVSPARIQSQIDVLNEDFRALPGSLGAGGVDAMIQFHLATTDPQGKASSGITYSKNDTWFADGGQYWNALAWDTRSYVNVYTNDAGGSLGYVPGVPQAGGVGLPSDRIVLYWQVVGKNAPYGAPYDKGRTATHEFGHYLGLYHTFQGSCGALGCNSGGDLICDTTEESSPTFGCPAVKSSCTPFDPVNNYMDYTDDACVWEFTAEQVRRMRCTLEFYRTDLWTVSAACNQFATYCAPGTSALGCKVRLTAEGAPSSTAPNGFDVVVERGPGRAKGILFFGSAGKQANPWGNGTSLQCVTPPLCRAKTPVLAGTLGVCDGSTSVDLNAVWCPTCPKGNKSPGPGGVVNLQYWYRDPLNTSNQTTSFSEAATVVLCP